MNARATMTGLALLLLGASGCSIQEMAADAMVPVFVQTKDDFNRGEVVRYAREAGPALLATLNGFVLATPHNPEFRLLQAEMNASFAFAFLEQEDPIWAAAHYRLARHAALVALADVDDDLAERLEIAPLDEVEARLKDADRDALPGLFWWGFARGAEINLDRSNAKAVADLARVDAVMTWVLGVDETYYNAGPHLYFAMRYVALPATLGGDPATGLKHFQAVERLTRGRHLMAKVLRAQHYAPSLAATPAGASIEDVLAAQRRAWEAYFGELVAVLEAPADLWPEQALPNAVAKQRARELLADPEGNNIIPPQGVENPYAKSAGGGGGWGDEGKGDGGQGGEDWGDGDW